MFKICECACIIRIALMHSAALQPQGHCRFICCMSLHAVRWPASQCRLWHAALQYLARGSGSGRGRGRGRGRVRVGVGVG